MKTFLSGKPKIIASLILGMALTYCGATFLLNDFPQNIIARVNQRERLLAEVERHKTVWDDRRIAHYRVAVQNRGYTSLWVTCNSAVLEVNDNSVVSAQGAGEDSEECIDVYSDLTVQGVFDLAISYIDRDDPIRVKIFEIRYDDALGFINHLGVRVQPTFFDPFLYGDDYLSVVQPVFFEIDIADLEIIE